MRYLLLYWFLACITDTARIRRQQDTTDPVVCSACRERQERHPNMMCCRCQDEKAMCNNDVGTMNGTDLGPGPICPTTIECRLFDDCTQVDSRICPLEEPLIETRLDRQDSCPPGQTLCCNPIPGDVFALRMDLLEDINSEELKEICDNQNLAATINFEMGFVCGKRDSRVYYNASPPDGGEGEVSNPGEWPWAVLIYKTDDAGRQEYVGAGTLMDEDVVITTVLKVEQFQKDPSQLTVRLGDWDPQIEGPNLRENFPHLEKKVDCIRFHPKWNNSSLEYNVAVIKLEREDDGCSSIRCGVDPRTNPRRPANRPEGVEGARRNPEVPEGVELRQGGENTEEERDRRRKLLEVLTNEVESIDDFIPRSYINTACLPVSRTQFGPDTRCWVAAWGTGARQQREVEIPLISRSLCKDILKPLFKSRGVRGWDGLSSSELCAGGESDKDTCRGEGGAPLVCLDKARDQYFAVGMVNYGFGCGQEGVPAVYVNLADQEVQDFITQSFNSEFC